MDFPIEYSERIAAEQMVMMEALQLIMQILICFVILMTFVILFVNLSDMIRRRLSEPSSSERRQPQLDQRI